MMITARNISKSYDQTVALNDVSFDIAENELFGFIGPDGAGKTTLFRILTSLLLPDQGTVSLDGLDVIRDYKTIRSRVGYMPGRFSLYTDLTVEENLKFFATVFGTTIEENYHLIHDIYVQIEPFKNRLAGKLSGGMKQKLALSCALIHQPRVLVLDEPTTGVDAVSRREFWELLIGLKEKGITILVSTPYMDEAQLCERVALIQKGKILMTDTPKAIHASYGRRLYSVSADKTYDLLLDLKDFGEAESVFPFGQDIHVTLNEKTEDSSSLNKYLVDRKHNNLKIKEIPAGIEDVFMKLMEEG